MAHPEHTNTTSGRRETAGRSPRDAGGGGYAGGGYAGGGYTGWAEGDTEGGASPRAFTPSAERFYA